MGDLNSDHRVYFICIYGSDVGTFIFNLGHCIILRMPILRYRLYPPPKSAVTLLNSTFVDGIHICDTYTKCHIRRAAVYTAIIMYHHHDDNVYGF